MYKVLSTISESGICLYSGNIAKLTLSPSLSEGIWFKNKYGLREKLSPFSVVIENHNTSIVFKDGSKIKLIEHLLSAIASLGISDIEISVDSDEIPLFDGSSLSYLMILKELVFVKKDSFEYAILNKRIRVEEGDFFLVFSPSDKISYDFSIDFKHSLFGNENLKFEFSPTKYESDIALARTFGFIDDLSSVQSFFKGANLNNTIVISNNRLLSPFRIDKELVRHKILDAIGDMRCFPYLMSFKYKSFGGSHKLNNLLLQKLCTEGAFEVIKISEEKIENFEFALSYV